MQVITTPSDDHPETMSRRVAIAALLGRVLLAAYPGRDWMVKVSYDCSMATVFCAQVSLEYGYVLHTTASTVELERAAFRAGGEILERFGLHRTKKDGDDATQLLRDGRGNVIGAKKGELTA
jgi:hypothetical protein